MATTTATRFTRKISEQFGPRHYVEISVLDGNGDKFDVYSGLVCHLTPEHLRKVFRDVGCFYIFTVLGIHEGLMSALDENQAAMRRVEFCWLVEPAPPKLEAITAFGAVLSWRSVRFCGFVPPPSFVADYGGQGVMYHLELSEAHTYKSGVGSHFASDVTASEYHTLTTGKKAGSLAVADLEPGTWYHARIVVVYMGLRFESVPTTFYTDFAVPQAPDRPRISVVDEFSAQDAKVERLPSLLLCWTFPKSFGLDINMCEVQFQEVVGPRLFAAGSSTSTTAPFPSPSPSPSPLYLKRPDDSHIARFLTAEQKLQEAAPLAETIHAFGPPFGFKAREQAKSRNEVKKAAVAAASAPKVQGATVRPSTTHLHSQDSSYLEVVSQAQLQEQAAASAAASAESKTASGSATATATAAIDYSKQLPGASSSSFPSHTGFDSHFEVNVSNAATAAATASLDSAAGSGSGSGSGPMLGVRCTEWQSIYQNKHNKLKLKAPRPGVVEWRFRVRVCNRAIHGGGWSEFSPVLYVHERNLPNLFVLSGMPSPAAAIAPPMPATAAEAAATSQVRGLLSEFEQQGGVAGHTASAAQATSPSPSPYPSPYPYPVRSLEPQPQSQSWDVRTSYETKTHPQPHPHPDSEEWTYIAEDTGGGADEMFPPDTDTGAGVGVGAGGASTSPSGMTAAAVPSPASASSPKLQRPTSDDSYVRSRTSSQASQRQQAMAMGGANNTNANANVVGSSSSGSSSSSSGGGGSEWDAPLGGGGEPRRQSAPPKESEHTYEPQ